MKEIQAIQEQYDEIFSQYSAEEFEAHIKGHSKKEKKIEHKKELLTHAYFLFTFTRLEDHVTRECTKLINSKKSSIQHWKTRAIWDNINSDNMHFKVKVGLLTEKGNSNYTKIVEYYTKRNEIAHGGTIPGITNQINMIDVFKNVAKYFKELRA